MPYIMTILTSSVSPSISRRFTSLLLISFFGSSGLVSARVLIQDGASVMPTTHHVISQIFQKFLNGCSIINNAMINATMFTATKIYQGFQPIPTVVSANLIGGIVILLVARQFV